MHKQKTDSQRKDRLTKTHLERQIYKVTYRKRGDEKIAFLPSRQFDKLMVGLSVFLFICLLGVEYSVCLCTCLKNGQ
jgi:hypothetical protein